MNTPPTPPMHKPLQIANPQPLDDKTLERRLRQRKMERAIDGGDREYEREQARKNAINA